ncbi:hypothetical protein ACP70R_028789 [Stipagrostis hirtigluma subsp. patula]
MADRRIHRAGWKTTVVVGFVRSLPKLLRQYLRKEDEEIRRIIAATIKQPALRFAPNETAS